jgi:hypothetical protein
VLELIGWVSRRSEDNRCLWFPFGTVTPEVSPNGGMGSRTKSEDMVFVRVNQVLVRLWALPSHFSGLIARG